MAVNWAFLVCSLISLGLRKVIAEDGKAIFTGRALPELLKLQPNYVPVNAYIFPATKIEVNEQSIIPPSSSIGHFTAEVMNFSITLHENNGQISYEGNFILNVTMDCNTENIVTGELFVNIKCSTSTICANTQPVIIKQEEKWLRLTATHTVLPIPNKENFTLHVSVTKDLATLDNITLTVELAPKDPNKFSSIENRTATVTLGSGEDSSNMTMFDYVTLDDYELTVKCGGPECERLSKWIKLPESVTVYSSWWEVYEEFLHLRTKFSELKAEFDMIQNSLSTQKSVHINSLKSLTEGTTAPSTTMPSAVSTASPPEEGATSLSTTTPSAVPTTSAPEAMCGEAPAIMNGNITYNSSADVKGLYPLNTMATYNCSSGYKLTGTSTRTCMENGNFTGVAPTCVATPCPDKANTVCNATKGENGTCIPLPTTVSPTTDSTTTDSSTTVSPSGIYQDYMYVAVGGFIALLVVALLGYLLYHYRAKVQDWVCSKKAAVSRLPRTLPRALRKGGRYKRLPRNMQEALHQD